MKQQDLKNLIADLIQENKELREFGAECLAYIFKEDNIDVNNAKMEYDSITDCEGYGLSLKCIMSNVALSRKNREEYAKKKQEQ